MGVQTCETDEALRVRESGALSDIVECFPRGSQYRFQPPHVMRVTGTPACVAAQSKSIRQKYNEMEDDMGRLANSAGVCMPHPQYKTSVISNATSSVTGPGQS